ncbi:MAG TPA: class I SAM-dependent methyltransferase [Nitrososphaeraceae archaeon]|nr:class I SAM-dependent methyltransferase [Nitrososphaeraceae archaeon]
MSFSDKIKLRLYIKKLQSQKKKRDQQVVDLDWDKGAWNKKYEDIDFESAYGIIGKDSNSHSLFVRDDKIFKGKWSEWAVKYEEQLLNVITKYADCPIVEFGCGLGRHLYQLHKKGFEKLEGYDVSQNAIALAKKHSQEKGYNIKFDVLNITKPLPVGIIQDKLVFTHACLEQLKHYLPSVLTNILNAKPKTVINFEVDYESSPSIVKEYIDALDYQNNLVSELHNLEQQNKIKIIANEKLSLSLSPVNRLSSIIWQPID